MRIHLIYRQYFDIYGEALKIGGVETYIANLADVLSSNGYEIFIYQFSLRNFKKKIGKTTVLGVGNESTQDIDKFFSLPTRVLVEKAESNAENLKTDILIFMTDLDIISTRFNKTIAIQHGIFWDIPRYEKSAIKRKTILMRNSLRAWQKNNLYKKLNALVCVDYNFINWMRAELSADDINYYVIPNFTKIPDYLDKNNDDFSVVFSRRFETYRGTRIFAEAIQAFLAQHPTVKVTLAGNGPDENYLKKLFSNNNNITFTSYNAGESITFHQQFTVAVVPSIGSEGTSLSLLEAMAASCAVISTDVGGLSNIVLDGFNGMVIRPKYKDLLEKLEFLYQNNEYRGLMAKNGYNTVKYAFSLVKWSDSWKDLIKRIQNED